MTATARTGRAAPRGRTSRGPARLGAVALALALASCAAPAASGTAGAGGGGTQAPGGAGPTPSTGTAFDQAVPADVAAMPFTDQDGRKVTLASLHGTTVVLSDFLTLCQEICPLTTVTLRQVLRDVQSAGIGDSVTVVEATVDPERDTQARLAAYEKLFGRQARWELLTGAPQQVAALWKAFGVSYERTAEPPGPPPRDWMTGKPLTYDVEHEDVVIVLGPDGHERWLSIGTPDTGGSRPPQPLWTFMSDTGKANVTAAEQPVWMAADVDAAVGYVTGRPVKAGG